MADGSKLDFPQVIKRAYDTETKSLKTINPASFVKETFDSLDIEYTSATVETYKYYVGGIDAGTLVATVVVTYTDATKENINKVESDSVI
jgi:hypothetical protein